MRQNKVMSKDKNLQQSNFIQSSSQAFRHSLSLSLFALAVKLNVYMSVMKLVQNTKLKAAMNSVNASFSQNISIVHPQYFFIIGLTALHRSLHSPKYFGVFNLALADIGETNALIPNMMKNFLFDSQYISFNACLANMFFVFLFSSLQSVTLVVLAYDRFIAICLPLRYHAIVNNTSMVLIFSAIWVFNSSVVAFLVASISRLSFCESNVIQSYFCDHGPMFRLACNDNSINKIMAFLISAFYIVVPLIIIVLSYLGIFLALIKITTWQGRLKALKTCVSHLLLVGIYFLPICCSYIAALLVSLTPNARVISTSLAYAVPPMLNPIIYVLNTAEIKDIIRKVVKNRSAPIRDNISK
ncbi:olfactory receptor 2A12-like isoform X3 [Megalobrama amblycephala]|uniref:olfactory receptor 2A12-like isoform X3 n=1 Tax=Megalobrama amblycephala TaxID=75352 RepID=UPI0020147D64|nr:olfactory receptor 2A12-like isoform X3 [Megalobrama amblycephala]